MRLDRYKTHDIELLVDRMRVKKELNEHQKMEVNQLKLQCTMVMIQ